MINLSAPLYVVATPIGNLEDMSVRAIRILSEVHLIAAEDTRHSARLLQHFGIRTHVSSFHEHNEREETERLIGLLRSGKSIALISDAGTPLVSDPGFALVRAARAAEIDVVPIPGPCAAVAALSVSGLPCDRFVFEGFPPARAGARSAYFGKLVHEPRTLIFYESTHRLIGSLAEMVRQFGAGRPAVLARELTKKFETIRVGTLAELHDWVVREELQRLGEFVIMVHGDRSADRTDIDTEAERILQIMLAELPLKQAAALAAAVTGLPKRPLYQRALHLRGGYPPVSGGTGLPDD